MVVCFHFKTKVVCGNATAIYEFPSREMNLKISFPFSATECYRHSLRSLAALSKELSESVGRKTEEVRVDCLNQPGNADDYYYYEDLDAFQTSGNAPKAADSVGSCAGDRVGQSIFVLSLLLLAVFCVC